MKKFQMIIQKSCAMLALIGVVSTYSPLAMFTLAAEENGINEVDITGVNQVDTNEVSTEATESQAEVIEEQKANETEDTNDNSNAETSETDKIKLEERNHEISKVSSSEDEKIKFSDMTFKARLIDQGVDKNGDSEITISEMEQAEYIWIYNDYSEEMITNMDELKYAKNLKDFGFYGNIQISSLDFLNENIKLESLEINNMYGKLTTLEPISNLINLKKLRLYINNANIQDVSFLTKLKKLNDLEIVGDGIKSGDIINNLNTSVITSLSINTYGSVRQDISNLYKFTSLKNLEIQQDEISDISGLASLTNLESLNLSRNKISDISVLKNFTKLKFLDISFNSNIDLDELENLCISSIACGQYIDLNVDKVQKGKKLEFDLPELLKRASDSNNNLYTKSYTLNIDDDNIGVRLNEEKTKIIVDTENLPIGSHSIWINVNDVEYDRGYNIAGTALHVEFNVYEGVEEKIKIDFEDSYLENYMKARYDEDGDGEITNYDMLQIKELILTYYDGLDISEHCVSLKGIENAKNATRVDFYTNNNVDLTPIFGLGKVDTLYLGGNNFDISKITMLKNLKDLGISPRGSDFNVDLSPIEQLTKLKRFQIIDYTNQNIEIDCNLINNKPNLEFLGLKGRVKNVDKLSQLKNLWQLDLDSFGVIEDISFVSGMENLCYLNLCNNKIKDITPLLQLNRLMGANLTKNPINPDEPENASTLETLKSRGVNIELDVYDDSETIDFEDENFKEYLISQRYDVNNDNQISKREMESIIDLNLWGYNNKGFKCVDELEYANNLQSLTLYGYSNNANLGLKFLAKLKNLKSLNISGSNFYDYGDFEMFEQLKNLEKLEFRFGNVPLNINRLKNCKKLSKLQIESYKGINNIEGLANLTNLESLKISQYGSSNIVDAKEIVDNINKDKLKILDLRGETKNADAIWQLKNLEYLSIEGENSDKNVNFNGIKNLSKLNELNISGFNFLTKIDGLERIKELDSLNKLHLDFGDALNYSGNINEEQLVDVIENSKCENARLSGNYIVNLKGVKCNSKKEVNFKDLGPIMKAVMTPESKLFKGDIEFTKDSYSSGIGEIEIDNKNKKIIINSGKEIGTKQANLESNTIYGSNGYAGEIRLIWNNMQIEEDPKEVNIPDKNLKKVLLEKYDLDDDKKITTNDMKNITELQLSGYNIEDLTGLEKAENIENLYLSDNNISNLQPLANLKNIKSLLLQNNKISDLTPIKNILKGEIFAVIADNYITDLSGLEDINYGGIDLGYNYLDVSKGSNNYKIIEESIRRHFTKEAKEHPEWYGADFNIEEAVKNSMNRITSWYQLSKFGSPSERGDIVEFDENVKKKLIDSGYDLNGDGSLSKGELSDADELWTLDLSNMNISNIENLKYLCKIKELNLSNNKISDFSPLKYCKSLRTLNLSNNKISNIEAVGDLFNVYELNLSYNSIKDITPLQNMRTADGYYGFDGYFAGGSERYRMLDINLANNQISNVAVINKLTTLKSIKLSENKVSDISTLANYDFNKLYDGLSDEEVEWLGGQTVEVDVSSNSIKVDSDGTKKAVKHFEENNSHIKLDNQTEQKYGLGDVNADGKVNVIDCTAILKHIKGTKTLTQDEQSRADINGDNKINVIDCTAILKHIKGTKTIE